MQLITVIKRLKKDIGTDKYSYLLIQKSYDINGVGFFYLRGYSRITFFYVAIRSELIDIVRYISIRVQFSRSLGTVVSRFYGCTHHCVEVDCVCCEKLAVFHGTGRHTSLSHRHSLLQIFLP